MKRTCIYCIKKNSACVQNLAPNSVSINGQLCSVQLNITLSNNVPPTTDAPPEDAAVEQSTVRSNPLTTLSS